MTNKTRVTVTVFEADVNRLKFLSGESSDSGAIRWAIVQTLGDDAQSDSLKWGGDRSQSGADS